MTPYCDSGVLIRLYVREPNSADAIRIIERYDSLSLNPLQELEIRNTFQLLEGRAILSSAGKATREHSFEEDIINRRLRRLASDRTEAFRITMRLFRDHASETLARSLDILHVGIAVASSAELFVTADVHHEAVARKTGLQTRMIA